MKKTNLDKLVPYSLRAHKKYCKMHHEVEAAATQLLLPLQKNTAPPAFKRLRRRGTQKWLGE